MTVSDIGQRLSDQFTISNLQSRIQRLQNQITTGKKARIFSDFDTLDASNSLIFRRTRAKFENFTKTINQVNSRITVMDSAMTSIRKNADDAVNFLLSQLQDTDPQTSLINQEARESLTAIQERMNVKFGDRFLFAGSDIANAPYPNPGTLDGNFNTLAAANLIGAPTVNSIQTDSRAITGTAMGFSAGHLAAGNVQARIDENTDLDYTVRADDSGFSDIMRGLSLVSNLPDPANQLQQDNFWTMVNGAIGLLQDGIQRLDEVQSLLGNRAQQLDERKIALDELEGDFRTFIGDTEDTDIAEATLQLQDLDFQLEASFRTTTTLRQLSLVNFL